MHQIMIVDCDQGFVAGLRAEVLENFSDRVRVLGCPANLEEAKEHFAAFSLSLNGVILDLPLYSSNDSTNTRNGALEFITYLRQQKRFPGTVIILSESSSFSDGRMAFEAGCDSYLNKSLPHSEIMKTILFCLEQKQIVLCPELRHLFLPEQLSDKEARLMDLLLVGAKWQEIAETLSYKNAHAACSTADRVFDKLLTWHDALTPSNGSKKDQALELWRARHRRGDAPKSTTSETTA